MCEVKHRNHGKGHNYYDVVCNGELIQRFQGASAKRHAHEMSNHLNKTYGV